MKYFEMQGDYLTAYQFCLENGGQLFCGNGKDSANVIVVGQKCYTFWAKDSKRKLEVNELCKYFDLDSEAMTGGRIARWMIDSLLNIPYTTSFWGKSYRNLAAQGNHWHYLYCDCKKTFLGIEVDIKSAYFASLFSFPSLLYQQGKGYLPDNNALENLKELYPSFPKWFRLQFLGCLASWRIFYYCRNKLDKNSKELVMKNRHFIKYNGAFNCAHRAILRNYKIMKKIHEIGGQYIRRMHTDSFFLDCDIPDEIELAIWNYVKEKGLSYTIKGSGMSFFWDINTGFIGNRFVGAKIDVIERMRADEIKMKSQKTNETSFKTESIFLKNSGNSILDTTGNIAGECGEPTHQELFDASAFTNFGNFHH